jgi:hypothetical protein
MTQEVLNSSENISMPHGISFWFQQNWTGDFKELGDIVVGGVTINPEFQDFYSYRNGAAALRKSLNSRRNASIALTLNEPNIENLRLALLGGAVAQGASTTVYEGRHVTVRTGSNGLYIDMALDCGETDFGNIAVTGVYAKTDVLRSTNLVSFLGTLEPNTDGLVFIGGTEQTAVAGDVVRVEYTCTVSSMFSSQIYGATKSTIEGAAKLQARDQSGGVAQVWDLASVGLSPNGEFGYGMDTWQTIPMTAKLQERGGTFGTIYTK